MGNRDDVSPEEWDASRPPTSVLLARRLLAREAAHERGGEPALGGALQRTCDRVSENLRDAMGQDGCSALFARALLRTEARHPALQQLRRLDGSGIHLDGAAAAVKAHGVEAARAAVEALLASLVEILGRLIGEDMAIRIMDPEASLPRTSGGSQAS